MYFFIIIHHHQINHLCIRHHLGLLIRCQKYSKAFGNSEWFSSETEQILNSQDLLKKEDLLMLSQNHDRALTSERYLNSLKHVTGKLKDNRIGKAVLLL